MSLRGKSNGFLLPSLLIAVFLVVAIGLSVSKLVVNNYKIASSQVLRTNAQLVADAGIDYAIEQLNNDSSWTGTSGEQTLLNDGDIKATHESVVTAGADDEHKVITVTGRTYQPASSTTPDSKRTYEVIMRGVGGGISGEFSVVSGVGGLGMYNNSKILGGEVYVNGTIELTNNAKIGQTDQPVNVYAAHQSCPDPPDSTYPRVCNSGENGEPINLYDSSHIYGDVTGTNQTDGSQMSNSGLLSGSVTPEPLPDYDRDAHKAAVTNTITASDAECAWPPKNNPVTLPANTKIEGDVHLSNQCEVTVEGNLWITGDLSLSNSAQLIVDDSASEPPVVMVDGAGGVTASNNSDFVSNSSSPPIGFRIITYWSDTTCSPDCTDVTGSALKNSQDNVTIQLSNGASGPNTEFYARWSGITISNSGSVGAVVGQTINLTNGSEITFGATVSGTSGGSSIAAWVVESYKRVYD